MVGACSSTRAGRPAVGFAILLLTLLLLPRGPLREAPQPVSAALASFLLPDFWIGVGTIAGIYAIFALGLQLNVGSPG